MSWIWNITNRLIKGESAEGVFLSANIVFWAAAVLILGLGFCVITGTAVGSCIVKLMCTALYAGIIVGLFGGIIFLMRRHSL